MPFAASVKQFMREQGYGEEHIANMERNVAELRKDVKFLQEVPQGLTEEQTQRYFIRLIENDMEGVHQFELMVIKGEID